MAIFKCCKVAIFWHKQFFGYQIMKYLWQLMKVPGNINNIANTIVTVIYQKLVVLSENKESLKGSQ